MFKWQEEVMVSDAKYVFARVCRGGGKTFAAVNWAVSIPNQKVLFVVKYQAQLDYVKQEILKYRGMIYNGFENKFILNNGSEITLLNASTSPRGLGFKATRIIVDGAGTMDASLADHLVPILLESKDSQMILLDSSYKKGSMMEVLSSRRPSSALYVSYDYVDMLRDREITPQQVFQFQHMMSKSTFAEEFGPYTTFDVDNQLMQHVLRSFEEYV